MKKKRAIKWILIALLAVLILLIISAAAFYFLELKPRIDVATAIGRAFADYDDCDALELDLEDGQQILLDISKDQVLSGTVYDEGKTYDGLEFGYFDSGIWLNIPAVSEKYYLLPWSDDVGDMLDEGAFAEILSLDDEQKDELSDTLIALREELLGEETYDFTPTFLNRLLGLECLKADILDIYKQIHFTNDGKESITLDGESVVCHKYTAEVSQEYVKRLLKTDGAGTVLNALGDILGDVYVEAYTYQGEIKYIDIETTFLYMPGLDISSLLAGDVTAENISFNPAPLSGEIYFEGDGVMDIYVELSCDYMEISASFIMSAYDENITWGYEEEAEINIFEVGYLRLLLEAAKWQEVLS